jgi:AT-rich interactive domain-containing protein 2
MSTQGKTDIPLPQAPTPHPGYAPHAALHAIKRHAVELMTQKEQVISFVFVRPAS